MKEVFQALKARFAEQVRRNKETPIVDDYTHADDWDTRDKYVRSLRRQVRRFQDQDEKKQLQDYIRKREAENTRGFMGGGPSILDYNTPLLQNDGGYLFGGVKKKNGKRRK